jgi:NAD(P)-dependent dehydrogenase (short-subunit alcohol dehydrogenase family)
MGPVIRIKCIQLPSDRDAGTYLFGFPALGFPVRETKDERVGKAWGRLPDVYCGSLRSSETESPAGKSELMTGKVVVITGGASGIGRAIALAFAREGAGVVIGDIDIAGAENTVATIRDMGGKADCLRVDVAKLDYVQALVMKAVGQYGGLDFASNNAGQVGSVAGIVETTEEDWNRVVATNLTGIWLCMKYEIPEMLKRGRRAIVNNGSVTDLVGSPGVVGNVASKHGSHQIGGAAIRDPENPSERCSSRAGAYAHGRSNRGA